MSNSLGSKKNYRHLKRREKIRLIEKDNPDINLSRQADLLDISRSSIYYKPLPVSQDDIDLMNRIDEIYTKYPFYGSRRISKELRRYHDIICNRKRIQRLMRQMGIEAIYPRQNTSVPNIQNETYRYLLNNLIINSPNQVWGTDITYIKLAHGFAYLVAIMDWFSRYVISWELSNSLEIEFVLSNLARALKINKPEIHNSDQGSHFTSKQYTGILKTSNVQISMDGRGRCMDNIFTERLWRTVKYENVYIKSYANIGEAKSGLQEYFDFYNNHRLHSGINDRSPNELYFK
jgi:putative transposase